MAIHQTKKNSDIEKRLKLLNQQVYGYKAGKPIKSLTTNQISDITYLYQDLLKISLLASFALGAQIILFYLSKNNFLRINFF